MTYEIQMPSHIDLTPEELSLLETLQERVRNHAEVGG